MESKAKSSMSSSEAGRGGAQSRAARAELKIFIARRALAACAEARGARQRERSAPQMSHGVHRRPWTTSGTPGQLATASPRPKAELDGRQAELDKSLR